jgi:transposase
MAYRRWLSTLAFDHPAQQIAFQDYVDAVMDAERRLKRIEEQIFGLLPEWTLRPVVDALQAMRGIALINAVVLVAEVGDFTRFSNPRQLMAYFGMVPGERSSGETTRRGGITKTGNTHVRRALVEGAWAYRMKARIGRHKVDRIEALTKVVRDIGWKAQVRLCARYRRLARAAKPPTSSMSPSHARWSASSCRSPARFNPRQRRRDDDLTDTQQRRLQTQNKPRRSMRRWGQDNAGETLCVL